MSENRTGGFLTEPAAGSFLDRLNRSSFDELTEIDLIYDRCLNLCHTEGKYFIPMLNGTFPSFSATAWSIWCTRTIARRPAG